MKLLQSAKKKIKKLKICCDERKSNEKARKFSKQLKLCGINLQLFGEPEVFSPERLSIGNNCKLNSNVYLNARSGITIGNDVTLSTGCKIISTGYDIEHWMSTGERMHIDTAPIYIGNHCWVGANAVILPGVNITGEYVVIGAGSVVTKDISESKVIVGGVPAKIIKKC